MAQGLGFAPEDTAAEQLRKLEGGLRTLASTETVALLADFLGLPPPTRLQLSPELQRRKTIDLLAQWNLSLSVAQPLVVFVEDLHWCDGSTLDATLRVFVRDGLVDVASLSGDYEKEEHPMSKVELSKYITHLKGKRKDILREDP